MQIGVDIGGTFTDIVALDRDRPARAHQGAEHAQGPADGIAAATTQVLALAGAAPGDVERFIHGTTVATNAILEQKGATTAILTTEGFQDVLEIGRMKRSRMYDLDMDPEVPTFLAPRRAAARHPRAARRAGPGARPARRGPTCGRRCEALRAQGVEAIAVCYLFSFLNPAHERRTRELIAELAPEISVSLSSDVDPTFREYERLCVTAFDAYLRPGGEALPGRARRDAARARRARRAADHALARRHRVGGAGRAAAGHALPLGAGRRRDRRARSPPSARACATSSRSTWAAPATTSRWSATAAAARRARARSAAIPVRIADGRREHHRRRRRQHRLDRRRRRAAGRAAQRRRRPRARLLRPRRRRGRP